MLKGDSIALAFILKPYQSLFYCAPVGSKLSLFTLVIVGPYFACGILVCSILSSFPVDQQVS